MIWRPPEPTRSNTRFPYKTPFRSLRKIDYGAATDDGGLNRDSKGLEVVAGTRIDISGIAFGDVYGGYIVQNYEDGALKTIDGYTVGADLTDRKSTRLNSSHSCAPRIPSSSCKTKNKHKHHTP